MTIAGQKTVNVFYLYEGNQEKRARCYSFSLEISTSHVPSDFQIFVIFKKNNINDAV